MGVLVAWATLLAADPASAQDGGAAGSSPSPVVVSEAVAPITVDGVLDDAGWAGAASVELGWEVVPGENVPARLDTSCRLAFDDARLYLGCRAEDPAPSAVRAYLTDRDGIEEQDRIVLTLDPFRDARRAFQFGVSALGVQYDAVWTEGGESRTPLGDPSWDAIWASAGRITERGYVIEAAIPFQSLRFPREAEDGVWGFFLSRFRPRGEDVELRSVRWDRSDACLLCQAGELLGIAGVRPGRHLQLTPTITSSLTGARPAPGAPLEAGDAEAEAGLDVAWGLATGVTLNGTVNPDFSQVEADAVRLEVNERFALFFPEKRPFFLEGAELFDTPLRAFFSRTVAAPRIGGKLSGKSGPWAFGLLVADDAANRVILPGSQRSGEAELPGRVVTTVGRLRRDVGGSSTVGLLLTSREGRGYSNRVASADALIRPIPSLTARLQLLGSRTEYPAATAAAHEQPTGSFAGAGGRLGLTWAPRDWRVSIDGRWLDEGLRLDAGFEPQVDVRRVSGSVRRVLWAGRGAWFNRLALGTGFWRDEDGAGAVLDEALWVGVEYEGPAQSFARWFLNFDQSARIEDTTHEFWTFFTMSGLRPAGGIGLSLQTLVGGGLDIANARPADVLELAPAVELRPGRHLDLRLRHSLRRLSREGREVLEANVAELRAIYNFTARSFLRAIVQYRRVDRAPALYRFPVEPRSEGVTTQLLFSYKLNPQTALFLGYSDDWSGGLAAGGPARPLEQQRRTLFLKMGYAWRP